MGITENKRCERITRTSTEPEKKLFSNKAFIRICRLHLIDNWWKNDCSPMLASTLEDESLVTLLPVKGDRYVIFDLIRGKLAPL